MPLAWFYMSDGWGAVVVSQHSARAGTDLCIRKGRFRHEFLLERALLKSYNGLCVDTVMLMSGPRGMKHGRGSWNIYAGMRDFCNTLREDNHKGIEASIYLHDGAGFEAFSKAYHPS